MISSHKLLAILVFILLVQNIHLNNVNKNKMEEVASYGGNYFTVMGIFILLKNDLHITLNEVVAV